MGKQHKFMEMRAEIEGLKDDLRKLQEQVSISKKMLPEEILELFDNIQVREKLVDAFLIGIFMDKADARDKLRGLILDTSKAATIGKGSQAGKDVKDIAASVAEFLDNLKPPNNQPTEPKPTVDIPTQPQYTIGIITALAEEYAAVKALLENPQKETKPGRGAGNRYLLGEIPAENGSNHYVALALLADMGTSSAAMRAARLLKHFSTIKSIIMVGIAGGIPHPQKPDEHVRLGDVVVSDRNGVVQYDYVREEILEDRHRHPPRPPSSTLLEAVRLFQANQLDGDHSWFDFVDRACRRLKIDRPRTDVLISSSQPHKPIRHPKDKQRTNGRPRIFIGPIASANRVLRNPVKRDKLRNTFGVKAVEMEGSGIADATWDQGAGYLVVRGITDYCDPRKNDAWRSYAAVVAAAYTRALLESIPSEIFD